MNLDSPKFDLSSIVYHFQRLNDIKLPMLLIVELNIFYFSMVWFYRGRMFVEDLSRDFSSLCRRYFEDETN